MMHDMEATLLKALADENRMRIVELLADGEKCICEIAAALDASDALASHHVKTLREAGVVQTRRVGRWLHCSLAPAAFDALADHFEKLARAARRAPHTSDEDLRGCACATPDKART